MKNPLVSVIILTIGRPLLIKRAIDSILAQTFTDFELIIGDASDNLATFDVVSEYGDMRIKYVKIYDEVDPALTINNLILSSKGVYVAFCDDDDEWISKYKLALQSDLLQSLDVSFGIVYCWYEVWDDMHDRLIEIRKPQAQGDVFWDMLGKNVVAGTPNLLIRKSLFEKYGGWVEGLIYTTDHLMLTNLSKFSKVAFVPDVLVRVHHNHQYGRQTDLGTTNSDSQKRIKYQKRFLDMFKSEFRRYPKQKIPHYQVLIYDLSKSGRKMEAARYLWQYATIPAVDKYLLKTAVRLFAISLTSAIKAVLNPSKLFRV